MNLKYRFYKLKSLMGVWLGLAGLISGLILGLDLSTKVSQLISEATYQKAEIVVDANKDFYIMPKPFNNLAQGGEESGGMLAPTVDWMRQLSPKYIRLDHIFDYYEVVKKEGGQLNFNFNKLDQEVEVILKMGAKPLLALSYMPPGLAPGVVDTPDNWNDWQVLVRKTVEHYSGKTNKNIEDVYYEVWNEPDLFGDFKMGGKKSYAEMYRQASLGATQAQNVNQFKLGGPATTGLYKNWIIGLLKLVKEEGVRLDFISWHRYSIQVEDFSRDIETVNKLAEQYPELALKEKLITEWGIDPKNNASYDNQFGAIHMLAMTIEIIGGVHKAFVFEVKDGKDPEGKTFWGRYGLLTHEDFGVQTKPRFRMMKWLNELAEKRLPLIGQGSFVKGVAGKDGDQVQLYLVNYDPNGKHFESVPIVVKNLLPGKYQVVREVFEGNKSQGEVRINQGTWVGQIVMSPNQAVRLTLKPI